MKIPCSVGILTFNSAASLERCLDSVKDFVEIIICDGGSTDRTLEIARSRGCVIIGQDAKFKQPDNRIADFSGVRNQMLEAASQPWFLYVDSDEYLSDEVAHEMDGITQKKDEASYAYAMPRRYIWNGREIKCSCTYPNYQMRFFKKQDVTGFRKTVHERIVLKPGVSKGYLKQPMYVPQENDVKKIKQKLEYYLAIDFQDVGRVSFFQWLGVAYRQFRVLVLFGLRYATIILICPSRDRLPFYIERLKFWYHIQITLRTFSHIRFF